MSAVTKTVAIFTARNGKSEALHDLLLGMAVSSRMEPGNLVYDVWRDQADPTRFVVDELYRDAAGAAAHEETLHYKNYAVAVLDLADRLVVKLEPIDIHSSHVGR